MKDFIASDAGHNVTVIFVLVMVITLAILLKTIFSDSLFFLLIAALIPSVAGGVMIAIREEYAYCKNNDIKWPFGRRTN